MNVIANVATAGPGREPDAGRTDRARFRAFVRDKATETVLREALGDLEQDEISIRRRYRSHAPVLAA
jgi:DNA-binding HxlR family transcriptional regulator